MWGSDPVLVRQGLVGGATRDPGASALPGGSWHRAPAAGAGLSWRTHPGGLSGASFLTADLLLDDDLAVFVLKLREGKGGRTFQLSFGLLPHCQARLGFPLEATNQNRWMLDREGALLKPLCWGERVDPARVDQATLTLQRHSGRAVRWCMTDLIATSDSPERLTTPLLPHGALLDDLGQSATRDWAGRSRGADEVTGHLRRQLAEAPDWRWPGDYSRWGGWTGAERLEATGYFRTHHDGRRWWLVDPDGHRFWSTGPDVVRPIVDAAFKDLEAALSWLPERDGTWQAAFGHYGTIDGEPAIEDAANQDAAPFVNYLAVNLIRAFGSDEWQARWAEITLATLRRIGFNTVANWSDWTIAREAGFPYVRALWPGFPRTPRTYRGLPDIFHPAFPDEAAVFAEQLRETIDDPAMIGYFLMNEPAWGFRDESPGAGVLFSAPPGAPARNALAGFLRERHGDDGLAEAWGLDANLTTVSNEEWRLPLTEPARADLDAFSAVMVDRYYGTLSGACRAVDPHHLNLGVRDAMAPPAWAHEPMRHFDVISVNNYSERISGGDLATLSAATGRPVLIGEWHFGALDAGQPGSGIGRTRDQAGRAAAYRVYLEDAAAQPWCVGAHWFQLYDQSPLGREDGENYNIGFLDVCNRPHEALADGSRRTHERLYRVAAGDEEPFAGEPDYLPRLFLGI